MTGLLSLRGSAYDEAIFLNHYGVPNQDFYHGRV